jgi:hypothetical protein
MAPWQKRGSQENRRSRFISVSVVALSTVAAILATVGVDRLVGAVVTNPIKTSGLIFHPHSTASYRTPEFTFTASTNALGFRDREFDQDRCPDDAAADDNHVMETHSVYRARCEVNMA